MSAVEAVNDGNYTNGETYQVTVTLEQTANVNYRFVFFDESAPAQGLPAAQQPLAP